MLYPGYIGVFVLFSSFLRFQFNPNCAIYEHEKNVPQGYVCDARQTCPRKWARNDSLVNPLIPFLSKHTRGCGPSDRAVVVHVESCALRRHLSKLLLETTVRPSTTCCPRSEIRKFMLSVPSALPRRCPLSVCLPRDSFEIAHRGRQCCGRRRTLQWGCGDGEYCLRATILPTRPWPAQLHERQVGNQQRRDGWWWKGQGGRGKLAAGEKRTGCRRPIWPENAPFRTAHPGGSK